MMNQNSKNLSRQMIKFIYLLSTSSISDINVVYKHDPALLFVYIRST
jgi:hypothetical protein